MKVNANIADIDTSMGSVRRVSDKDKAEAAETAAAAAKTAAFYATDAADLRMLLSALGLIDTAAGCAPALDHTHEPRVTTCRVCGATTRGGRRMCSECRRFMAAAPVRQHLLDLMRAGKSYPQIAASADVPAGTLAGLLYGTRNRIWTRVSRATGEAILAIAISEEVL